MCQKRWKNDLEVLNNVDFSPSSKKIEKSHELAADLIDLSSPGSTDGESSVSYSRCDSVHSNINHVHVETNHHHSMKDNISLAATDDKNMKSNSVDAWIDHLDAERDTSYFPHIHYDMNFISKLATIQNIPRVKITKFNALLLIYWIFSLREEIFAGINFREFFFRTFRGQ